VVLGTDAAWDMSMARHRCRRKGDWVRCCPFLIGLSMCVGLSSGHAVAREQSFPDELELLPFSASVSWLNRPVAEKPHTGLTKCKAQFMKLVMEP
jgi:hypothetical protein